MINQELLDKMTHEMVDNKHVFSTVFCVEDEKGSFSYTSAAGEMKADDFYYIASVTKLYITAVVLILKNKHQLNLDEKIINYFPDGYLDGLHIYQGVDYTHDITIKHLISNTSGIPDYFFGKDTHGQSGADELLDGKDSIWSFEKTLSFVKNMKPKFKPGQKGKAEYSDTNYQLLGQILTAITGKEVGELFQTLLFKPLELKKTYIYCDPQDQKPASMYYQKHILKVPLYMSSIASEGGIVSTAKECMIFLKAFFGGFFFDPKELEALQRWHFMLRPATMYFGVGLEKLWTPWYITGGKSVSNILGFWGQTGSFAFYHQDSGLYFTGTANQINGRGHNAAYKAILKLIRQA